MPKYARDRISISEIYDDPRSTIGNQTARALHVHSRTACIPSDESERKASHYGRYGKSRHSRRLQLRLHVQDAHRGKLRRRQNSFSYAVLRGNLRPVLRRNCGYRLQSEDPLQVRWELVSGAVAHREPPGCSGRCPSR